MKMEIADGFDDWGIGHNGMTFSFVVRETGKDDRMGRELDITIADLSSTQMDVSVQEDWHKETHYRHDSPVKITLHFRGRNELDMVPGNLRRLADMIDLAAKGMEIAETESRKPAPSMSLMERFGGAADTSIAVS
jgi:hypothetical protein